MPHILSSINHPSKNSVPGSWYNYSNIVDIYAFKENKAYWILLHGTVKGWYIQSEYISLLKQELLSKHFVQLRRIVVTPYGGVSLYLSARIPGHAWLSPDAPILDFQEVSDVGFPIPKDHYCLYDTDGDITKPVFTKVLK